MGNKVYKIRFTKPAPKRYDRLDLSNKRDRDIKNDGWQKWSLPIGNGHMGVCVFGRTDTERLQVTENSLYNPQIGPAGGITNFCEIWIDFGHQNVTNYERALILNNAVATVDYTCDDVKYHRECFVSYPDKVFVLKITASVKGAVSFTLRPEIPFLRAGSLRPDDGCGKEGTVTAKGSRITLSGKLNYYNEIFEGLFDVHTDGGEIVTDEENGRITVTGADSATVFMSVGTNYKLCPKSFCEKDPKKKLEGHPSPKAELEKILQDAEKYSYDELLKRHTEDFVKYFDRVVFDIGGKEPNIPTDELVENYHYRDYNKYLEEMSFQFGRYLIISSARPGSLPSCLSGVWSRGAGANCAGGYFHNINEQMNYWAAFTTNLAEMFEGYAQFWKSYVELAKENADKYIKAWFPEKYEGEGKNGWSHGSNMTPFFVECLSHVDDRPVVHSGPGMGGLTALLFNDYYDYTNDLDILKNLAYPAISSMANFMSKTLEPYGDNLLVKYSASPEQLAYEYLTDDGPSKACIKTEFDYFSTLNQETLGYSFMGFGHTYYNTIGCSFDQQMIYETFAATLRMAKILGIDDELTQKISSQIDKLDPTPIGASGQIKEFREENYYGEIGDVNHRHISQLHGLLPGVCTFDTKEKYDAAKVTLDMRGPGEEMDGGYIHYGFALAFRICLWAKLLEGERAYQTLNTMLGKLTFPNLMTAVWEIDANTGITYAIGDMLVQDRNGHIELLGALPSAWSKGKVSGMVTRGNFEIDLEWKNMKIKSLSILSRAGSVCNIRLPKGAKVLCGKKRIDTKIADGIYTFETEKNMRYTVKI